MRRNEEEELMRLGGRVMWKKVGVYAVEELHG